MTKITILDEATINQIAAGEVIENPSSVVKELTENSIDAGATEIYVEIRGGGRQLIRISDNGCGMSPDDALLCLERHGTSKIRRLDDIYSLSTMGFRGEAVPSIASISKFTLITAPHNAKSGTMVIVEGGKILKVAPAACAPGTTIEVKSLFFNVPVRKKFQKSPAYDANEIYKVLTHLSLGYPKIKFQLISDQKNMLSTHASTQQSFLDILQARAVDVLGNAFASSLVSIDYTNEDLAIQGWIGSPTDTRPNRLGQYLFINQRAIQSPLISYAIRQGYGTLLPANRHPIFILHFNMPGNWVDVNVHPQKKEVRLRQQQQFTDQVAQAIARGLQGTVPLPSQEIKEWISVSPPEPSPVKFNYVEKPSEPIVEYRLPPIAIPERKVVVQQEIVAKKIPRTIAIIREGILVDSASLPDPKSGICLFDQQRVHKRILFERFYDTQEKLALQNLLIPHPLNLDPQETSLLLEYSDLIHTCGIHTQQIGPNQFVIDALSPLYDKIEVEAFMRELFDQLHKHSSGKLLKDELRKRIALTASELSVAKHVLTIFEGQKMIEELFQCTSPFICPKGKPTMIVIGEEELNKRFLK